MRVFGGWRKAIEAAGIRYSDITLCIRKYLTPESVIAEIQRRQKNGLSIRSVDIQNSFHADAGLYYNARKYFGQWVTAVKRAGFSYWKMYPPIGTYHTRREVLGEIRRRYRENIPINCGHVCRRDSALYHKALGLFGNWRKAVEAAGIPYDKVKLHK